LFIRRELENSEQAFHRNVTQLNCLILEHGFLYWASSGLSF
jgi:hypothetical protein